MKEIIITQNKTALVDDEDFEYLNQWKWYAQKGKHTWYACRDVKTKNTRKNFLMHREILKIKSYKENPIQTDHRDGNGLNNQKNNLRLCSDIENNRNRKSYRGNSRYKGVQPRGLRWEACIIFNRGYIYLGRFDLEVEAAIAYDQKATELFGEFANLNFPKQA